MFTTTIHNNHALSGSQKFTYLQSSLTGYAAVLIRSFTITDANYSIAWDIVNNRYQNERELYFSTINKFISHSPVVSDTASSLRTLVDATNECTRTLDSLEVEDKWDSILVFLLSQKLDSTSRQFWELSLKNTTIPSSQDLLEFMEQRARSLHASSSIQSSSTSSTSRLCSSATARSYDSHASRIEKNKKAYTFHTKTNESTHHDQSRKCKFCNGIHPHYMCSKFLQMTVTERGNAVREAGICFNCLRPGHLVTECSGEKSCSTCYKRHHSLLHREEASTSSVNLNHISPVKHENQRHPDAVMATAMIQVKTGSCHWLTLRAFCDGGAAASFISLKAAKRLCIPQQKTYAEITGFGSTPIGNSSSICQVTFKSCHPDHDEEFQVPMFIVKKLTGKLPSCFSDSQTWPHIQNLPFTDPNYNIPNETDILLGADIFFYLLLDGIKKNGPGSPVALNSKLGWLIGGSISSSPNRAVRVHHANLSLEPMLQKFWEMETLPKVKILTKEEAECEEHFGKTHSRDKTGRYVIMIPMKIPNVPLGSSRKNAERRLLQVERRLQLKPKIREEYQRFMEKYETLGHMRQLTPTESQCYTSRVFLPYHFIVKDEDMLSKFRVVFDASAKTSSGYSLNDAQLVGPTIQRSLHNIIIKFRLHPIAFTADVEKMYRQILVHSSQQDLQCILWRKNPSEPVCEYKLLTVTYGTASGSFLATRVLKQLASDEGLSLPLASAITAHDFYVDDCISGADSEDAARKTINELREICSRAGMSLAKFSSNSANALLDIPLSLRAVLPIVQMEQDEQIAKTLGLNWDTLNDDFLFRVTSFSKTEKLTKRLLLSQISTLFDPMGWLAPSIIMTKIMMQELWKVKTGWDESPPQHIADSWTQFKESLKILENIRIPRCIRRIPYSRVELHGFCDASENAYAAVVYTKALDHQGVKISLITSKTKVAPLKTISIPRLELCGAYLLAELMESVQEALEIKFGRICAWTDSTIVLAWLTSSPSRWRTFVANRVSKILEILPRSAWAHVNGIQNPADCASRGILPQELLSHDLWWNGPKWLESGDWISFSPQKPYDMDFHIQQEEKRLLLVSMTSISIPIIHMVSSLNKLKRLTSYWFRFIYNCHERVKTKSLINSYVPVFQTGPFTAANLDQSLNYWVKRAQVESFFPEITSLTSGKLISKRSKLLMLSPFVDSTGILRVGGRLANAKIHPDRKNPIILPRHHRFTELVIQDAHAETLHGGPQLVQAVLLQRYWILRGRDAIRHQLKKCVVCTRHRAVTQCQLMGNLPENRVNPSRSFSITGVDYAGPFLLRPIPARSKVTLKGYLALFVCFATRAIHLELVSSLSTEAFLATLKRFIARRGKPAEIQSDCGTNFIGVANELENLLKLFRSNPHNDQVSNYLSAQGIKWKFNAPSSPHFGGLWEAGIKSVKHHLNRVIGTARLTFEELATVFCQIESLLNSRPLTPFSSDPNDFTALTPAHCLIGDALHAVAEPNLLQVPENRLNRWQFVQTLSQHFWNRWSKEYLSRLQQRPKWQTKEKQMEVGDLVVVKSDGISPSQWPLARILKLHPGKDALVRIVTIKTSTGEIKRPVVKLCLLPIDQPESHPEQEDNESLI